MSTYQIIPSADLWVHWKDALAEAKIQIQRKDKVLGDILFAHTPIPEAKPRLINLIQYCGATTVNRMLQKVEPYHEPIHPFYLIALIRGMQWKSKDWYERRMRSFPYELGVSPFLLPHPDGRQFMFMVTLQEGIWSAGFMNLSLGDYLPRCMHIWGVPTAFEERERKMMFTLEDDGNYGMYYTCS